MVGELIKMAWRNIWRNKRRSYITMSSVGFAVLLSCLMMSVQYGSLDHMVDNVVKFYSGHIQIHDDKYWDEKVIDNSLLIDQSLMERLESLESVSQVVPRIESFALSAFGTKTKAAMILGIDTKNEAGIIDVESKIVDGKYLSKNDQAVLVSTGLAKYLDISLGDSVVLISQGFHGSSAVGLYPVVGFIKFPNPDQNNQTICMPIKEAQWFYGMEDRVSSVALLLNNQEEVRSTFMSIDNLIEGLSLKAMDWSQMMPDLVQTVNLKHSSSRIMIMVLYCVIGFGMFGTYLMMTAERIREFGTTIAVGMNRALLQVTVFLEILLMAIMGVISGMLLSLGIITYFNLNPIKLSGKMTEMYESYGVEAAIMFAMKGSIFIYQAWAIFIIATVLSFYPILVLQRLNPVDAMRQNG